MTENIKDIYPLSPMQQGMLFHTIYDSETTAYTEQLSCKLIGDLDIPAFKKAWQAIVDRHDILRSAFVWEDLDEPLQVVHQEAEIPFERIDWRNYPRDQQNKEFEKLLLKERQRGLELTVAPLMRVVLVQTAEDTFRLIWNHHHLLIDGWGLPIILKEVMLFYSAFSQGKEIFLPQPQPYKSYIAWLLAQDMDQARKFWSDRLSGFMAPTPLPVSRQPNKRENGYNKIRFFFSEEDSQILNRFSKENQITLNTLLQAAWAMLLHRYSGEDDVVFGATVSGRPPDLPGVEEILGLFINTLPVRAVFDENRMTLEWLKEFQLAQAETRQYEYTPLVEIHKWSDVPNSRPLFESILVFENYPAGKQLEQKESVLQLTDVRSFERTNYPLTIVGSPGTPFAIDIAYETDKFSETTIRKMQQHLRQILIQFTTRSEYPLSAVSLLTEEEEKIILFDWNSNQSDFPKKTIHELFKDQADKHPQAIAVSFKDRSLTYGDLDKAANRLANFLRHRGVEREMLVGICLERSIETVVASLAVLKAGAAYLPIDPDYPQERIDYMVSDSAIRLLITQKKLTRLFKQTALEQIVLDELQSELAGQAAGVPVHHTVPENLAYVIYTSGSTGRPKGVLLNHLGAANLFFNMGKDFLLKPGKSFLQLASFSFDAATGEIFSALLNGATLQMVSKETLLSTEKLVSFLNEKRVSAATLPPSLLSLLPEEKIAAFETIASVGDACSRDLAERWKNRVRFINGYGPTEGTIGAIWGLVGDETESLHSVPIGRPIRNVKIYILDKFIHPVPVGVPGEIHIGGPGVARGYLNRTDLTAEKFIPDPFSGQPDARMYKTGDLARWLPDGRIEFLGRVDFQVKIRGFRIELGEIEAEIAQLDSIKDVVVLVRGEQAGEKSIVAYLIADDDRQIDITAVRSQLKENLPDYMIPSAFVVLNAFPLLPNGKINRKALPAPDQADRVSDGYMAPRTPEEELLSTIWADILKLDRVGVESNFFDLGGHSLMATQVISRIRDAFAVDIDLKTLFETPTIAHIAREIDRLKKGRTGLEAPPMERVNRNQDLPLSFAQQRLWFLDQLEPNSPAYNIPSALRLLGQLDVSLFEKSIRQLIKRHETLRTTFDDRGGKPVQVIHEQLDFHLEQIDFSPLAEEDREHELMRQVKKDALLPFNLAKGPLFRARLIKMTDKEHVILFNMHHIISDGWSIGVMINEIALFYRALAEGKSLQADELDIQYADFAYWQQHWLQGEVLQKHIDYWKKQLAGAPSMLALPTDRPRPPVQTFNGTTENFQLDEYFSRALQRISKEQGVTLFMILLAAFQTLLHRYSGQETILVGSPIANRTNSKLEKLIGFFVNTLVLKADFSGNPEFTELLSQVRETALGAYAHQDMPFEKLVEELQPERDMSHSPLFQVAFAWQNAPLSAGIQLPDLTMRPVTGANNTAKYDLTLTMNESGTSLVGSFEYNTDIYDRSTILRMIRHFKMILQQVCEDQERTIAEIELLDEADKQKLFDEWNRTESPFPSDRCVHRWFEQIAQKHGDEIALIFQAEAEGETQSLSYREMNAKANQLAHYLVKNGVKAEDAVGISMNRSLNMAISMMAVLKAGAAYVPIDPTYPKQRIEYMIRDSGLSLLLSEKTLEPIFSKTDIRILVLDELWPEISNFVATNPDINLQPENLAYIIYTSGSTGKPKGTLLHHRGACNLAALQQNAFKVGPGSRILQFASLSFDAATWEFLMAMLSGSTLVLSSAETIASGQELVKFISELKITTVTLPPSVLAVLPGEDLPALKTIITAGEAVSGELVAEWSEGRRFFNAYGPTETTVCASIHECKGSYPAGPPIGKPNPNFKLYVLDQYMKATPIGVPGELCVSGVGLARGYHQQPELTAVKFIPNPFAKEKGQRLYRTGDLVRWLPDGNIEFLGRIDQQIKIRGFRVELGEIESVLSKYPGILDQRVLVHEDRKKNKRIVAYITVDQNVTVDVAEVKTFIRRQLPDYMTPSVIMVLDEFPLTPNGKIDRNALPAPEFSRDGLQVEFIAPRNATEETLVAIVKELLAVEKVGVNDNFFELGGHSLLATQFMSRVKEAFNIELPLKTLFEKPTVAGIAESILAIPSGSPASKESAATEIKRVDRSSRRRRRSEL